MTALGAEELPIQQTADTLRFPWLRLCDGDELNANAQFIAVLCKIAKEKKRVVAKRKEAFENPRFTMRVWLIGLGMIGQEFKLAWKLLVTPLRGNSAWRTETRVELIALEDPYAKLKPGDRATVQGVDDAGHLMCQRDFGSTLNLIPGVDKFRIVGALNGKIREQIQAIRMGAKTNMLDANTVQRLAYEQGLYELVNFIESNRRGYARYIITGE